MGIVGSVLVTPTVSANTLTASTATFPQAGLTVVKIWHGGTYLSIPIDSTKSAIFPSTGGVPGGSATVATLGTGRRVNFAINGTVLNFSILSVSTGPNIVFYYGTPLEKSKPLAAYSAVVAKTTLSTGSGTGTWAFPSGPLKLIGVAASVGQAAASTGIEVAWNTSSGQSISIFVAAASLTQHEGDADIFATDLTVSQQVTTTITLGTGSDVVYTYAYYQ